MPASYARFGGTAGPGRAAAVTPSNTVDLPTGAATHLNVAVAGAVSVLFVGDTAAVTINLAAGFWHAMRVKRVQVTGTTATGIVAGYD